ncbi:MAG: arginase family protein [Chloroflexi bacterium]|nr:arginase family protein [Chloroflexota bacterium]
MHFLTPYFLDRYEPALLELPHEAVNEAGLLETAVSIQERVLPLFHQIADWVAETAADGRVPISWAGDCCASLPVLAGLQRAGIAPRLLWLDAHGDFNTWETTPSGFLGGMPLAMMVGLGEQTWLEALQMNTLPAQDVILADGRDLDPGERDLVEQSGIGHVPVWEDVQAAVGEDERPLWVHFDVDVLRLEDVPAVSYPATGGPSHAQLRQLFAHLRGQGRLAAVSLSLYNPNLPGAAESQAVVLDLLAELVGEEL